MSSYIERLQEENKRLRNGLDDIKRYCQLPKFNWPENHVNVNDILLRINEIESYVNEV